MPTRLTGHHNAVKAVLMGLARPQLRSSPTSSVPQGAGPSHPSSSAGYHEQQLLQ